MQPSGRKRRLVADQPEEDGPTAAGDAPAAAEEDLMFEDLPTDVEATIMLYRGQLRTAAPMMPPVVLHTHLYATLKDRTSVDREIERLRLQGKLRVFKLGTDVDEYAVMLMEDYAKLVETAANGATSSTPQPQPPTTVPSPPPCSSNPQLPAAPPAAASAAPQRSSLAVFFLSQVIPACKGTNVEKEELAALHSSRPPGRPVVPSSSSTISNSRGTADMEAVLSALLRGELLSRDPLTPGLFTFTIPGAGAFLHQLQAGRQELLGLVAKKRYREAMERELLGKKLRRSCLGMAYHVRDLVCRGALSRTPTPAGPVLRVTGPT